MTTTLLESNKKVSSFLSPSNKIVERYLYATQKYRLQKKRDDDERGQRSRMAIEKVSLKKAKRLMAILSDSYLYGPSYHQTAAAAAVMTQPHLSFMDAAQITPAVFGCCLATPGTKRLKWISRVFRMQMRLSAPSQ